MNKLSQALAFLKNGISIIPLRHRGKEPEAPLIGGAWEKFKTQLPTEYQVATWLTSTWQNYGVVAGWNNLAFLDFDSIDVFDQWYQYFTQYGVCEQVPFIVRTARGAHVYVQMPAGANEKRIGVDVKFHGYVVGPGSVHPNGAIYTPDTEYRLVEVQSLEAVLPIELFPRVAPVASVCQGKVFQGTPAPVTNHTEYQPFQAAMWSDGEDLITKVKQMVRIENMFANISKSSNDGRWYKTLCPFHDDHNPSMWIDTRRQICGCSSCNMRPMDVINLYARQHNISESAAVSALARECGVWG